MSDSGAESGKLSEARRWLIILACIASFLLLTCTGGWQFLVLLALGWAPYFWNHVLALSLDWVVAVFWVLGVVILLIGLHTLCVWLAQQPRRPESESSAASWPFPATLKILFALLALATAGIGMIGVAHQLTWLAHKPGISVSHLQLGHTGAMRSHSQNNLKSISLGSLNYEATHGYLPQSNYSPVGRPLHNWITFMLPQLEQFGLYDQIDFRKPWNDPTQGEIFGTQLELLLRPGVAIEEDANGKPVTHYAANKHIIGGQHNTQFRDIKDGASNTIFFGEINDQFPAWGQPLRDRDPGLGLNVPGGFGSQWQNLVIFAFGDGSVKTISLSVDPEVLRQLATPAGGEKVPSDAW